MEKFVSIIIASYNAENYIANAIDSILRQTVSDYEIIIIDGGSKDKTVDIIKEYSDKIHYWISEPDRGIYDAWNKGLTAAKGEWVMFLGCDDSLLDDAIENYQVFLGSLGCQLDYVSSRINMIDLKGRFIRTKGWKWEWPFFLQEMTVAHPGSLHARRFFNKYGTFDITFKITGDYELLLRPKSELKAAFLDKVTVLMSEGGASDSVAAMKEHYRAAIRTGGASKFRASVNFVTVFLKYKAKNAMRRLGFNIYLKK